MVNSPCFESKLPAFRKIPMLFSCYLVGIYKTKAVRFLSKQDQHHPQFHSKARQLSTQLQNDLLTYSGDKKTLFCIQNSSPHPLYLVFDISGSVGIFQSIQSFHEISIRGWHTCNHQGSAKEKIRKHKNIDWLFQKLLLQFSQWPTFLQV